MPISLHRRGAEAFEVAFDDRKGDQWIISFVIVVRRFCTPQAKDRIDVLRTFVPDIAFGERIAVGGQLRILTVARRANKTQERIYPIPCSMVSIRPNRQSLSASQSLLYSLHPSFMYIFFFNDYLTVNSYRGIVEVTY